MTVGKEQVTEDVEELFDFKMCKPLVIAKIIMLIFFGAAIVIFCFGVKEIIDVKHMKTLLNTNKPTMGMILNFLAGKHLGWAGLAVVIGGGAFVGTRFVTNNKKA